MRVMVSGLGGELGTAVAQLLEARPDVEEIAGFDFVPPRRRLRRSVFHRIDPLDRDRVVQFVTEFAPSHLVHFGVYEPGSRMEPKLAAERTIACTVATLGAASRTGNLVGAVVRSSTAVYGRGPAHPALPDEWAPVAPTSPYGRTCVEVEAIAKGIERRYVVPVARLRFAPEVGSHVPSPLGRVLRLPFVPVPALSDPSFQLLAPADCARAMVAALTGGINGSLNVVGPGATTPWQVARLGGRVPVPVVGPGWSWAAHLCEIGGAPMPEHVAELLRYGRVADGSRAAETLGISDFRSTPDVCTDLHEWADVVAIRPDDAVAS